MHCVDFNKTDSNVNSVDIYSNLIGKLKKTTNVKVRLKRKDTFMTFY